MALQDKKEELESQNEKSPASEQAVHFEQGQEKILERKELSQEDKIVSAGLRREIEMMELNPETKIEAEKKAKKIEFLGEKEKVQHLLQIAREKGLVFAIQVARRTNDPAILDNLHDILTNEGYYKDFTK